MFRDASSFNQDLGWCVDDNVDLDDAYRDTPCELTSCGIYYPAALMCGGAPMSNIAIRAAVTAWLSDSTSTEAAYGHISTWETGGVKDMSRLFSKASSFNDDITGWDTSGVRRMKDMFKGAVSFNQPLKGWNVGKVMNMHGMFSYASSFNQPLGGWNVDEVENISLMFCDASAFNQDLGWCVDANVDLKYAFDGTIIGTILNLHTIKQRLICF